ncbi:unnamed protein product [Albugo candida]|uniref:Uncharacterized protein n=1 Tax=Albugo candida TaxID=65357 RepID=A0A024FT06_9STRA|nr:unnamed protein product [Albugo candida]|eukprot:CCI10210.1 unnamed protein product [Albugo candida]
MSFASPRIHSGVSQDPNSATTYPSDPSSNPPNSSSQSTQLPSGNALNLHQNLGALQTHLYTLQLENSKLTKSFTLKENYVQLKDQQVRLMQQRLEELEQVITHWKEKYHYIAQRLQQEQQEDIWPPKEQLTSTTNSAPWKAWKELSEAAEMAAEKQFIQSLPSQNDEKLQRIMEKIQSMDNENRSNETNWDVILRDVSPEMQQVIARYLCPKIRSGNEWMSSRVSVQARYYTKKAMDLKVMCSASEKPDTETEDPKVRSESQIPMKCIDLSIDSLRSLRPDSIDAIKSIPKESQPSTLKAPRANSHRIENRKEHLFDCVDCSLPLSKRVSIPHGSRQLHPNKAVYISRPVDALEEKQLTSSHRKAKRSRGYSHVVRPPGNSRTASPHTRTLSHASVHVPVSRDSGLIDQEDRISAPLSTNSFRDRTEQRKIKKLVGSMVGNVKDRFQRQRSGPIAGTRLGAGEDGEVRAAEGDMCDGCGRGPISGFKWICRTCYIEKEEAYELCDKCYGHGLHGKEQEDALFDRIRDIVVTKCTLLKHEDELIKLLQVGICKANLKKFSFCLMWIADLLQCRQTKDLRARALEISQISPQVRSVFVRLLSDLLQRHRSDIELKTEWEPLRGGQGDDKVKIESDKSTQLDTLRIWVTDAQTIPS